MSDIDAQIGRNVARYRGSRSQKDVAEDMRARGWKWSQATVWGVEKGDRPLRVAEAEDLAPVLGVMSNDLTRMDESAVMRVAMGQMTRRRAQLEQAIQNYTNAQYVLAWAVDEHPTVSARERANVMDWITDGPAEVVRSVLADAGSADLPSSELADDFARHLEQMGDAERTLRSILRPSPAPSAGRAHNPINPSEGGRADG